MVTDIKFINSQLQLLEQAQREKEQPLTLEEINRLLHFNETPNDDSSRPWTPNEQAILLTILIVTGLLTIAGNVLVVLCVSLERSLHTVSNYFLASLSVADLIVGVLMMPLAAYLEIFDNRWPFGQTMCNVWLAADVTASTASILGLIAIAYNRYIAIVKPFTYGTIQRNPYIAFWAPMGCIWVISAGIASPIVFGVNQAQTEFAGVCSLANLDYLFYSSIFSFFIPSAIMVVLYVAIFRALAQRAQRSFARRFRSSGYFRHLARLAEQRHRHRSNASNPDQVRRRLSSYTAASQPNAHHVAGQTASSLRSSLAALSNNKELEPVNKRTENPAPKRVNSFCGKRCVYDENSGVYLGEVGSLPTLLHATSKTKQNAADDDDVSTMKEDSDSHVMGSTCLFDITPPVTTSTTATQATSDPKEETSAVKPPNNRHKSYHPSAKKVIARNASKRRQSSSKSETVLAEENDSDLPLDAASAEVLAKAAKQASSKVLVRPSGRMNERLSKSSISRERKATTMLVIVLVLFFVCWCPFFTSNVVNALCMAFNEANSSVCSVPESWLKVFVWLGYGNSTMNPIVYAIFNLDFRRTLRRIIFGKAS